MGVIPRAPSLSVPTAQPLRRGLLRAICAVSTLGAIRRAFAQSRVQPSATIQALVGEAKLAESGLLLTMPLIAETGNAVSLAMELKGIAVARWIVVAEKNPRPIVLDLRVGEAAAASSVATRVRLGASQRVVALAQTRAGAWHMASADVALTGSACYDGT